MSSLSLNETDQEILKQLRNGRNVPSNLADDLNVSRQYIQQRLKRMEEHGYVRNIGRGVYEIIDNPQ